MSEEGIQSTVILMPFTLSLPPSLKKSRNWRLGIKWWGKHWDSHKSSAKYCRKLPYNVLHNSYKLSITVTMIKWRRLKYSTHT